MEIHQIRYVVAVARTGNFSRAAEMCHVAQPSLSQQILKLEDELGEKLFERLKSGARLTNAGKVFFHHALRILDEIDSVHRDLQDARDQLSGVLTVGILPTIAPYFLPQVISTFAKACPQVQVVVQEDTTSRLFGMISACEVDLAVLSPPLPENGFTSIDLFREELVLTLPATHPFVSKPKITTKDLEEERFILMKEGHCLGDQVLQFCNRRDFNPSVSCRSAQIETVQALVQAGMGISLVPRMACRLDLPESIRPSYRSLEEPVPYRTIVAAWNSQRHPNRISNEFIEHLKAEALTRGEPSKALASSTDSKFADNQGVPWWGL